MQHPKQRPVAQKAPSEEDLVYARRSQSIGIALQELNSLRSDQPNFDLVKRAEEVYKFLTKPETIIKL